MFDKDSLLGRDVYYIDPRSSWALKKQALAGVVTEVDYANKTCIVRGGFGGSGCLDPVPFGLIVGVGDAALGAFVILEDGASFTGFDLRVAGHPFGTFLYGSNAQVERYFAQFRTVRPAR